MKYNEESNEKESLLPSNEGSLNIQGELRYNDYKEGKGTIINVIFGITNTAVGAGVLAFPFAYNNLGLITGIIVTLIFVCIVAQTLRVVAFATDQTKATSYQDLVYKTLGKKFSKICEVILLLYLIGACIAYMEVIGDMVEPVMNKFVGQYWYSSRKFIIVAFSVFVMFPLCLLKRVDILSAFSGFAIVSCAYLTGFVTVEGIGEYQKHHFDLVRSSVWTIQFLSTLPILCFAFQSHILVPALYADLRERSLSKMDLAFIVSLSICCLLYMPIGFWGYVSFGSSVPADILLSYDPSDIGAAIGRICISFTVTIAYPLNAYPARSALASLLTGKDLGKLSNISFYLITLILFGTCLLIALFVPGVNIVFSAMGSLLGVWIIFLFPSLFAWKTRHSNPIHLLYAPIFALFGLFIGITGTVMTIYNLCT